MSSPLNPFVPGASLAARTSTSLGTNGWAWWALPLLTLAACNDPPAQTTPAAPATTDLRIPCTIGTAALACAVDRDTTPRGPVLTIRHPDGGFRRLLVTNDGRGVIAADGAQPTRVRIVGTGEIEVAIGPDTYRLPATIKAAR